MGPKVVAWRASRYWSVAVRTEEAADRLARLLGRYAFRLFLRGAIQKREGFAADEATAYVQGEHAHAFAEALVELGLATATTVSVTSCIPRRSSR